MSVLPIPEDRPRSSKQLVFWTARPWPKRSPWLLLPTFALAASLGAQESLEAPASSRSVVAFNSAAASPNLAPYGPSGWSDKLVVSKTAGNHTDSALAPADTLYLDWAVLNGGDGAANARFYTEIYVDGALRNSWYTDPPLDPNFYTYVEDYSLGSLSAGTHTIRIKTDSTNAIAESDETNNEYTRTITVGSGGGGVCVANATTLCLNGGRFRAQVSFQTASIPAGVGTAVPLTGDTGYFWFFSSSNIELVVKILDGRAFNNRFWVFYGALSDIAYTINITDMTTGAVKTYSNPAGRLASVGDTGAFSSTIGNGRFAMEPLTEEAAPDEPVATLMRLSEAAAAPNLAPFAPSGWSDKLVVSRTAGNHTDSALAPADTLYLDWAVLNGGDGAATARFYTEVYVDGTLRNSWYTDPPLNANFYAYVEDYSLGSLSSGTHTIRIKTDSTNAIAESDETNNEFTKTITVVSGGGGACAANATTLCLNGGRFRVQVSFQTASIPAGVGTAVPLTGDTGYFWFFSSSNVELVVKILDGRAINNYFWVFYGALSDIAYTITITDMTTGTVKTYSNPAGRLASVADTRAFGDGSTPPPPPGSNRAPTLTRVDATRVSHSFGRDDAYRSEGVANRPGFAALQTLTTSRMITLDNDANGQADSTSPIVLAAANLASCCTLLVAEGAADPDNDALVFHWQASTGTFYSTGTQDSGGFAFGAKITDLTVYNRNSIFYELPSIGTVILNHTLMGGSTSPSVFVTDVRSPTSASLSSPTRSSSLEWGRGAHLEIVVLDGRRLPADFPDYPNGLEMTVFANITGNFLANTLATFRVESDHPDGREVGDQSSANDGARIQLLFKESEIGHQATITIVASTPGVTTGANPFIFPASTATPRSDLWRSRGCTIGERATVTIEVKTGPQSIDVWDAGAIADDAFDLTVDGANLGRTPPGGDRLFTDLSLSSGAHSLCVVYVDCSACSGPGTYAVRLNGGMTFAGGSTEQSGELGPSAEKPSAPYAQVCFTFQVP